MCGIIGYAGTSQATDVVISGLKKLEYRGYDSAGISVFSDGKIKTVKSVGRIAVLEELVNQNKQKLDATVGIGHTRWATHGKPTEKNAHPHFTEKVSVVHNGIIENYLKLKNYLESKGYQFETETDSEIVAKLLDYYYTRNNQKKPIEVIAKTISRLEGAYALAIMFEGFSDRVYGVRKECPLLAAVGANQNFLTSDMGAVLEHTNKYYEIEYQEIVEITKDEIKIMDLDGNEIQKNQKIADWDALSIEKCGYEHFMIKEINEQPQAIVSTISPRIKNDLPDFGFDDISEEYLKQFNKIVIVACGTAMHAGMVGKTLIEKAARIPVEVDVASEFRYRNPILSEQDLVVVISQSGETADTLAALRLAKSQNVKTLAIVNVQGSSIAREADKVILTFAGPEIAVASTKAYIVQLAVMYLLAFKLALIHGKIASEDLTRYISVLREVPAQISKVILASNQIKDIAVLYQNAKDMFFLGRGLDYAIGLEGALKLKEISYINCQAYQAGELKHGTISLITEGMPVVCVVTQKDLFDKMVSNVKGIKARGASIILITTRELVQDIEPEIIDKSIIVQDFESSLGSDFDFEDHLWSTGIFMPLTVAPALQLLAYHMAVVKNCDVDKPRNLAKSVTVE